MSPTTFIQPPHGLACDGCGIAKDDLLAIETMEKKEQMIHELFRNAALIRNAMRSNHLLRPIFRKYGEACGEIRQNKKEEVKQLARLADYCDEYAHDQYEQNHDLKCIQYEMREIHDQIKSLEEMQWTDDDSDSSCSSDCSDSEDEPAIPFHGGGDANSVHSSSSDSGSSSLSDSGSESDLSDVMEFLRQSQVDE